MKKLLLSMALLAGFTAAAETYTLEVKNATDVDGTVVEEKAPGEGGSQYGEAKHVQPLKSAKIDNFTFTFAKGDGSTEPALYYPMSTNESGPTQFRVYKAATGKTTGNTMTIAAPAGVTFAKITFTGTNGKANVAPTANVGTVTAPSATSIVWQNSEAVSTVTLTLTTQAFRITSMEVSTEAGAVTPDPDPEPEPTGVKFSKVTELVSGTYVFVVNEDGTLKLARPYIGTQSYGRMNLTGATLDGNDVVTTEDNSFEITVADGKATIKNGDKYYAMDAPENNHFTSFQFYTELNEGCYWTYEFVDGAVKMTNALSTECFISQTKGTQGTWFTNVAPANAPAEYNLPMLYKKASGAGVEAIEAEADSNAPVVYYNLQGQRIAHPANGLYIRVQGNKVEKVVVR